MKSEKINDAIGMIKDEYIEEAHMKKEKKKFVFSWELIGKLSVAFACVCLVVTIVPAVFSMGAKSPAAATADYAVPEAAENGYGSMDYGPVYDVESSDYRTDIDLATNKKLIVSAYMDLETLNLDETTKVLADNVNRLGGYFQTKSISNSGYYRVYDAVIRIPADNYDEFISEVKGSGNTTYFNEQVDDVTESYTDIEARLTSLKAEEAKVLEFYDKATSLSELMDVESRLSDIRYQIDSYENSIKNYDLLINYSTLNITIRETKVYSEDNLSFGTKLLNALKTGWSNFTSGIKDFIIDIAYNIWSIIFFLVIIVVAIVVIKKIRNRKAGQ